MGFTSEHRGLASIDLNAPSMKRLINLSGKAPPIGASPGEMRLWLKLNGLLDDSTHHRSKPTPRPRLPPIVRDPANHADAERIRASAPMVGYSTGKTAGRRGGRVGRSGSVQAALAVAKERTAIGTEPTTWYTDQ